MTTSLFNLRKAALAGLMGAGIALAGTAQAVDLNLVFLSNEQDEEYDAALVFKNYVESRTGGEVNVNIFPGAQLCGSAPECYDAMQAGVVDVYTATAGGVAGIYPPIQGMDIPYAFPDDRTAMAMLQDPQFNDFVRREILDSTNNGIRLLAMSQTGGWRNFANSQHEVRSPADVEGLRLRTIESQIQQTLVREMGGSPTPLPWLEVYTALQTGVVDGTKNSISDIISMNFHETLDYLTLDGHAYMASMWLIGNDKFKSLTPAQQRVVADGGAMLSTVQMGMQPRDEIEAFQAWIDAGGEIYKPTDAEMDEFRSYAEPIRDWYLENNGAEGERFLEEFDAARERAQETVNALRSSATQ